MLEFGEVRLEQFKNMLLDAAAVDVVSIAPIVVNELQPLNMLPNDVPASVPKLPVVVMLEQFKNMNAKLVHTVNVSAPNVVRLLHPESI